MDDEEKNEKKLGDILKKVASIGLGAAFLTEDAIKQAVGDIPLPKNILNGLLENAKQTKSEFVGSVKNEFKSFLNKIDPSKEIEKVIENYEIEVNAKVNFKKKKK